MSDATRRSFIVLASSTLALAVEGLWGKSPDYAPEVAGIRLPRTARCVGAYELCRTAAPAFLLNHSLRTYLFGALHAAHHGQAFDAETAFIAAILHDLGLLQTFASPQGSFEVDGADRAEHWAREHGAPEGEASKLWNAIVMHDMRFSIASHQSPEATRC
jgi:HD superfamily phosphodiesterase